MAMGSADNTKSRVCPNRLKHFVISVPGRVVPGRLLHLINWWKKVKAEIKLIFITVCWK